MEFPHFLPMLWMAIALWVTTELIRVLYNVLFHPLRKYPGPVAASATDWWKTYVEVFKQESMTDVLLDLHKQHGLYSNIRLVYLC